MSNKKETPVSWLVEQYNNYRDGFLSKSEINHALQMESQKQQKYDEMLVFLGRVVQSEFTPIVLRWRAEEIIKETKEL